MSSELTILSSDGLIARAQALQDSLEWGTWKKVGFAVLSFLTVGFLPLYYYATRRSDLEIGLELRNLQHLAGDTALQSVQNVLTLPKAQECIATAKEYALRERVLEALMMPQNAPYKDPGQRFGYEEERLQVISAVQWIQRECANGEQFLEELLVHLETGVYSIEDAAKMLKKISDEDTPGRVKTHKIDNPKFTVQIKHAPNFKTEQNEIAVSVELESHGEKRKEHRKKILKILESSDVRESERLDNLILYVQTHFESGIIRDLPVCISSGEYHVQEETFLKLLVEQHEQGKFSREDIIRILEVMKSALGTRNNVHLLEIKGSGKSLLVKINKEVVLSPLQDQNKRLRDDILEELQLSQGASERRKVERALRYIERNCGKEGLEVVQRQIVKKQYSIEQKKGVLLALEEGHMLKRGDRLNKSFILYNSKTQEILSFSINGMEFPFLKEDQKQKAQEVLSQLACPEEIQEQLELALLYAEHYYKGGSEALLADLQHFGNEEKISVLLAIRAGKLLSGKVKKFEVVKESVPGSNETRILIKINGRSALSFSGGQSL